jgi:hypothetical protein
MNKFAIHALALTGILAVSGLPAFAAEVAAPAVPAPNAAISTDTKANVGTSIDKSKGAVDKSKASTEKKIDKQSKDTKDKVHQQTAAKPMTPAIVPPVSGAANSSVGVGATGVNGSASTTVQH